MAAVGCVLGVYLSLVLYNEPWQTWTALQPFSSSMYLYPNVSDTQNLSNLLILFY